MSQRLPPLQHNQLKRRQHHSQRLPSAPLSVSDCSVAVTQRGQHGDRQTFESAFPVDTFSALRCLGV
jgi:hypothetical protein